MKRKVELTIDFNLKKYDTIRLKQMNTTEFVFKIIYGGLNVDLSNNTVNIIFTKPNNTIVIQSENITTEGNIITATLNAECLRQSGNAKMEIEIKDTNNNVVSSFYINLIIEPTSKNNITAENTPNYIEYMDKTVTDLQQKGESTIKQINEDYDTIVEDVNQILNNYKNIKSDVENTVSAALETINQFNISIVSELPTENIDIHTIYFVLKDSQNESEQNIYNEYIYINGIWELIGNTGVNVSLATQEQAGLMSPEDKAKLDELENTEMIGKDGEATDTNTYNANAVKELLKECTSNCLKKFNVHVSDSKFDTVEQIIGSELKEREMYCITNHPIDDGNYIQKGASHTVLGMQYRRF